MDAKRFHGSNWEKIQGRKNVRCGKLDKGTISVESLKWKEQEEYLEMITVCWLLFMCFLWHLLLATGLGKPVVWLDFAAVAYPPSPPVRPHFILSCCMGPGAVTTPTQSLSEGHKQGPPTASRCLKAEATWVRGLCHEARAQMDTNEIPKHL